MASKPRRPSPRCTCTVTGKRETSVRSCPVHGDQALQQRLDQTKVGK